MFRNTVVFQHGDLFGQSRDVCGRPNGRNHKGLMSSLGWVWIFVPRKNISPEDTEALKWWLACLLLFAFPGLVLPLLTNFLLHACVAQWTEFLVSVSTLPQRNPVSQVKSDPTEISLHSAQTTTSTHSFKVRSGPRFSGRLHQDWQTCWDHGKDSTC